MLSNLKELKFGELRIRLSPRSAYLWCGNFAYQINLTDVHSAKAMEDWSRDAREGLERERDDRLKRQCDNNVSDQAIELFAAIKGIDLDELVPFDMIDHLNVKRAQMVSRRLALKEDLRRLALLNLG